MDKKEKALEILHGVIFANNLNSLSALMVDDADSIGDREITKKDLSDRLKLWVAKPGKNSELEQINRRLEAELNEFSEMLQTIIKDYSNFSYPVDRFVPIDNENFAYTVKRALGIIDSIRRMAKLAGITK